MALACNQEGATLCSARLAAGLRPYGPKIQTLAKVRACCWSSARNYDWSHLIGRPYASTSGDERLLDRFAGRSLISDRFRLTEAQACRRRVIRFCSGVQSSVRFSALSVDLRADCARDCCCCCCCCFAMPPRLALSQQCRLDAQRVPLLLVLDRTGGGKAWQWAWRASWRSRRMLCRVEAGMSGMTASQIKVRRANRRKSQLRLSSCHPGSAATRLDCCSCRDSGTQHFHRSTLFFLH